jgi:hypothetical protein
MSSFGERVVGALKVRAATFEEVEHDPSATWQAAAVVLLASVATAIGWSSTGGEFAIVRSMIGAIVGWGFSAALIWLIGTKMLPGRNTEADIGQILRACGFAQAAGMLHVVAILPLIGWFLSILVIGVWVLIANVIAVRQALDYDDTPRALAVCAIAWVVQAVIIFVFGGVKLL